MPSGTGRCGPSCWTTRWSTALPWGVRPVGAGVGRRRITAYALTLMVPNPGLCEPRRRAGHSNPSSAARRGLLQPVTTDAASCSVTPAGAALSLWIPATSDSTVQAFACHGWDRGGLWDGPIELAVADSGSSHSSAGGRSQAHIVVGQ